MVEVPAAPVPPDDCRQRAVNAANAGNDAGALVWVLLAISADLSALRRELRQRR